MFSLSSLIWFIGFKRTSAGVLNSRYFNYFANKELEIICKNFDLNSLREYGSKKILRFLKEFSKIGFQDAEKILDKKIIEILKSNNNGGKT